MNINFKTHFPWPGADGQPEPTNFRQQILNCMKDNELCIEANIVMLDRKGKVVMEFRSEKRLPHPEVGIKKHTIRRINNGKPRYREGMNLGLQGGSRFKPVPFAETVCTGVQLVQMDALVRPDQFLDTITELVVRPEGRSAFYNYTQMAVNDGLSPDTFTRWFLLDVLANGPGEYQLVHWTDLRY